MMLYQKSILTAKRVFTPIAICFLLYFAWNTREQLGHISANIHLGWMMTSLLLWSGLHFISPAFTIQMFAALSVRITYAEAFLIHSRRLPAKYLPGGIWHSVARAADYHSYGFSKYTIGAYLLLENVLAALVTLTIGSSVIAMLDVVSHAVVVFIQVAVLLSLISLSLIPLYINKLIPDHPGRLERVSFYQGILCLIIYWIVAAFAFVCFITGIPDVNIGVSNIQAGGVYIFSWGVGFIALFAPQGIGVSEFISAKLLNSGLSAQSFVVLLAAFRFVSLSGDLLVWLLGISVKKHQ